jgi:hypothetical protein
LAACFVRNQGRLGYTHRANPPGRRRHSLDPQIRRMVGGRGPAPRAWIGKTTVVVTSIARMKAPEIRDRNAAPSGLARMSAFGICVHAATSLHWHVERDALGKRPADSACTSGSPRHVVRRSSRRQARSDSCSDKRRHIRDDVEMTNGRLCWWLPQQHPAVWCNVPSGSPDLPWS